MNKIASFSVKATSLIYKYTTLLGFVFGVYLTVFSQLMGSMGKLAFLLVRAETILNVFFAQLALLFVLFHIWFRKLFTVISR